ncbi:hypothetical protein [Leptolyngbya sp. NIES-2104]|uniref:hypothetical protein n=1 Tax=Leptolyngbya sp. NIES-2104 TaxID=1552121 RepID=UPI000AB37C2C|nr:hypothetical protein [Leptolyngbya sp. NIES-2104]
MTKTLSLPTFPQVPAAARSMVRPMLFAALGLHALLLFTPFPKEQEKPPENKEAPVKITQLPTTKSSARQTPKVAIAKPKPALPRINRPNPNPIVQKSIESPTPQEANPPESATSPQSQAQPSRNTGTATAADFPHYSPSTPNCFNVGLGENCRVATANLNTVAAFYLSAPKAKGFALTPDEETADKKIYTVTTPDKKTLFLHLFKDEPTTVILLSDSKVSDLAALKGSVNIPADYYNLLTDLAPQVDRSDNPQTNAQPEQFPKPEMFFNVVSAAELQTGAIPEMRPGIDGSPTLITGQTPDVFFQTISTAGLSGSFQVTPKGQYGGGNLYQLKKETTTFYMNLVPTKDRTGTIVVTWLRNPGS